MANSNPKNTKSKTISKSAEAKPNLKDSKVRSTSEEAKNEPAAMAYDSNPFTLSFRAFSDFFTYAQNVAIIAIVLGLFGLVFNFAGNIVGSFVSEGSTEQTITDEIDSRSLDFDFDASEESITAEDFNLEAEELVGVLGFGAAILLTVMLVAIPIGSVVSALWKGFIAAGANAAFEQRKISAGQAFRESTDNFGAIWVAIVISTFKVIGGYILFIVPGVRAQLRYAYVTNIIIKEKISGTAAIKRAEELNNGHLLEMMGIGFVGGIIPLIGSLIAESGRAYAFRQIDHVHRNKIATDTHWLNYLGLIISAVLTLLILLVVIAVASFTAN